MERDILIETVDLKKVYGEGEGQVIALDGINLQIDNGEFVAIMGPSGSGKSTLMNILGCMDRPTEGKYILAGEDVSEYDRTDLAQIRGQFLGFVFQSYNLLPRMTALENVMMPMMYHRERRTTSEERLEKAVEVLQKVGLGERIDHLPSELSGGQQQRVAIARALINDPLVIFADEPTGNLDSRSGEELMELLDALHQSGKTIVMVTHDENIARHTERIIHILDGKLAYDRKNGHKPLGLVQSAPSEAGQTQAPDEVQISSEGEKS